MLHRLSELGSNFSFSTQILCQLHQQLLKTFAWSSLLQSGLPPSTLQPLDRTSQQSTNSLGRLKHWHPRMSSGFSLSVSHYIRISFLCDSHGFLAQQR